MKKSAMDKIRLGIVGTNFVSDWLADAVSLIPDLELDSVLSRTEENGARFAEAHAVPSYFCDDESFFNSGLDAVYIAVPNSLHFEYTLRALNAGINVLCEKPIASNRAEFIKMRDAAEKSGLVLLEAMRPAYDPALDVIRGMMSEIGTVRHASLVFCQYSSRYDRYRSGEIMRAFMPEFSNAAVMDIGVYPIHICLRLFGYPTSEIISHSVILENGFEGAGEILIPYDSMSAVISYSKIADSHVLSTVTGEDGEITIDRISAPGEVNLTLRSGKSRTVRFSNPDGNMVHELREFCNIIRGGKNFHMAYSDMEMQIIDEVRRQNGIIFPADCRDL